MSTTSTTSSPSLLSSAHWRAALAGAGGGLLSFFVGEIVGSFTATGEQGTGPLLDLMRDSGIWSGAIGLVVGAAILIYDNTQSLRGQWHRDLLGALPLFFALSFAGGVAGQLAFSIVQNSLTRGIGWALMGASIGAGIGILRRDGVQAQRGALGGALGGFIGGFIFDGLAAFSSAGGGSFSRVVGQILMGALIALLMRVVQEALQSAWLLGISTGPYEGKQYPLNTARVTVGRADSNDISLFREETAPAQLGALIFQNGGWWWEGGAIAINGAPQSRAPLAAGDTLQMGATRFRFQTRSMQKGVPSAPLAHNAPFAPTPLAYQPAAPAPRALGLMTLSGQWLRVPEGAAVSVGRSSENQIVLADAGVSSRHAELKMAAGRLSVTDLGSTNGTFVNGAKLPAQTPHSLQIGDRVRFGSVETSVTAS